MIGYALGLGIVALALVAWQRSTRARGPAWTQHALSLGFEMKDAQRLSASRTAEQVVTIRLGADDPTKLQIVVEVRNDTGLEVSARTTDAGATRAPWVVTTSAPAARARAFFEAIAPTSVELARAYALVLEPFVALGVVHLAVGVIVEATLDRKRLRDAIAAAERLAKHVELALQASKDDLARGREIPRLGEMSARDGWYRGRLEGALGDTATIVMRDVGPLDRERLEAFVRNLLDDAPRIRRQLAMDVLATHEAWFVETPVSTSELAEQIRVRVVRVPSDFTELTLELHHRSFAGNVVEAIVTPDGRAECIGVLR